MTEDLRASWEKDEQAAFAGWDFSYIHGRSESGVVPWDYESIVREYLKSTYELLDMGTGGGEFILSLGHPYERTSVTEAWLPNLEVCRQRLAPLGIGVHHVEDDAHLPFEDEAFDIVINRHEALNASEVARILRPGGYFITQQVGGKNNNNLSVQVIDYFQPRYAHWDLAFARKVLEEAELEILISEEAFPKQRFFDVGALVYFAMVIEWEFPGFSVDGCFDRLLALHAVCKAQGYIEAIEHRFMIVCQKKG